MTPTALTPAARGTKKATKPRNRRAVSKGSSPRSAGHRPSVGKPVTPRRVSGPIGGVARPQRVFRPTHGPTRPTGRRPASRARPRGALRGRAAAFVRSLPDHSLLDRIVRGRAWIPILGVLLAGIVAMQVETLKLSSGTGRALERGTALESRNQQLRASVAVLGDDQRIERLAYGMGMVMPGPTTISFLYTHQHGDALRALNGIHPPNGATFLASLPAAVSTSSSAVAGAATPPAAGTTAVAPAAPTTTPTPTGTNTVTPSG